MRPDHLWRRILNAMSIGTITQVNDTGPVQKAQVKVGYLEIHDDRPVVQQFGLSSVPPLGCDAVVIYVAGNRSSGVIIGTNHQATRPTGRAPGETTLFNSSGMSIYLSAAGIVINGGGVPVHLVNGDLHVDGAVVAGFGGADQVTLQGHRHGVGTSAAGTVVPTPGT